ncbi:unnamed protein product [Pleuronectes platessa]|uniref:Uncharacterized protein n=1 Tax=Pleuronectes platessa TaxID=8262 RepID=A0A9N7UTJ2_PLEPL|nr:unnamed protein product [Pleuronectes platessa]
MASGVAGSSEPSACSHSASVPLSKPGGTNGPSDRRVKSASVTTCTFSDGIVREEGAIMGPRIVWSLFSGELAKSCRRSYGTGPTGATMFNGKEQVVIVSQ